MKTEIQSKSDFLTGATLTVRIPEEQLDRKALNTIQEDMPEFILPFHCRSIDGNTELIYQIGRYSKLQYLAGSRKPKEYAEMWTGVLGPLLDCDDWFMKPYSFAMSAEFLYYDRDKKAVGYVYIPAVSDCSDHHDLIEMTAEVSKLITVTDSNLENKVLRAILKDFDPKDFLKMLRIYIEENIPAGPTPPIPPAAPCAQTAQQAFSPTAADCPTHKPAACDSSNSWIPADTTAPAAARRGGADARLPAPGDIVIDIPAGGFFAKKSKEKKEDGKASGGKKEKGNEKQNGRAGLFGRKNTQHDAAAENGSSIFTDAVPVPAASAGVIPGHYRTAGHDLTTSAIAPADSYSATDLQHTASADFSDTTQNAVIMTGGARLIYTGRAPMPPVICVEIKTSGIFSIGRYDSAAGKQQSSFEFDRRTKAVSRRHAVIERGAEGYSIVDLASSAGTFVNGQKLPANTPFSLKHGSRVSFGNAGADYIWEEW